MNAIALLALYLAPGAAHAGCHGTYTADQLFEDLQGVAEGMTLEDKTSIEPAGRRLKAGIVCAAEPIPGPLYASIYRSVGVYEFYQGKPDEASLWFRSARELEPTYAWDITAVEVGSPLYKTYEAARSYEGADEVLLEGVQLVFPSGSMLTIDGRSLEQPQATLERYHIVQQVAQDGTVRASWVVAGNSFPERLLEPVTLTLNEEKEEKEEEKREEKEKRRRKDPEVLAGGYTSDEVVTIQSERSPLRRPLIAAGAVGLAGAAGVYAASYGARQTFDAATTVNELDAGKTLTNSLVIASAGVAAVGLGVGVFGFMVDGQPTIGMTVEF
jgi:hypothetical protein